MNPLQYAIYKGTGGKHGAVQFNLQLPHYYRDKLKSYDGYFKNSSGEKESVFEVVDGKTRLKESWKIREGAVFCEITSAKGKNIYDWDNKIIFALSVGDMGRVIYALRTGSGPDGKPLGIFHDPGAKTQAAGATKKYLTISSPNGTANGAIISITQQSGGEKKTHSVPITGDELMVLAQLLSAAIPKAMSW